MAVQSRPFSLISLFCIFALSSCAPSRMYLVSVVERSSEAEPAWLSDHRSGMFIGIGEAQTMEAANRTAVNNLMAKISQEIGVELEATGEVVKVESGGDVSEKSNYEVDMFTGAILHGVVQRVTNSYWEHCRAQTSKKSLNDFYRYCVLAEIEPEFIDSMRAQTGAENERRKESMDERLTQAKALLADGESVPLAEALDEIASALQIATTLFYDRWKSIESISREMAKVVRSLRMEALQAYSEVRPERHYFVYRVTYFGKPVDGLKCVFKLTPGRGRISETAFTSDEGEVTCDIFEMYSQVADNLLSAAPDFSDTRNKLAQLEHNIAGGIIDNLDQAQMALTRRDRFSTLARTAFVTGGTLDISSVDGYRQGIYKRVSRLDMSVNLTEHNGRDVTFNRYSVVVSCWFVDDPIFPTGLYNDSRVGNFSLPSPFRLKYSSTGAFNLPRNENVAALINDLKSVHEIGMRQVAFEIALLGEDDAGNEIAVKSESERMAWDRLFER